MPAGPGSLSVGGAAPRKPPRHRPRHRAPRSLNIIYLVSGGAPNGSTDILITEAFRWAFERDRYGYAAAYSTVIFLVLLVFTVTTNRITNATKGAFE